MLYTLKAMLIPRSELTFQMPGAKWDLDSPRDRKLLGWVLNQFLYGEVTGIQCGYWLYRAPSINAASFIARQAVEEFSHVKRFLKILEIIGEKPAPAHGGVRFLSTGMMGGSWGEHVCMEMALGEGLVLTVFYVLAETIPSAEIQKIIEFSIPEEERHVEFGEKETMKWIQEHPKDKSFLLGQALIQGIALKWLRKFILEKLSKEAGESHPILSRFPEFYDHIILKYEERIVKMGLSPVPLYQLSIFNKMSLILGLPFQKLIRKFRRQAPLLTKTYLDDPVVKNTALNANGPTEV